MNFTQEQITEILLNLANKKSNITPYGGLFFTADVFNKKGVKHL